MNSLQRLQFGNMRIEVKMNQEPTCRCGFDRHHPWVVEKPRYSPSKWLAVLTGISVIPKTVVVACDQCGFVFEESDDLERRKRMI
ncbi:MAG: hypothetical protein KDC35_02630 [Acidobacteria bacterium]|nr:hypothetical protein [Acidobacteriota bacterium]